MLRRSKPGAKYANGWFAHLMVDYFFALNYLRDWQRKPSHIINFKSKLFRHYVTGGNVQGLTSEILLRFSDVLPTDVISEEVKLHWYVMLGKLQNLLFKRKMDTQLYIKILIVQASFLHCFFACFTLVFFWLQ